MPLKLGDKVSYQGQGRFRLGTWTSHKYVKPGDIGVVVKQGTDTRPWAGLPSPWWKVDFGEERVVKISAYDLQIQQYRHEGT